MASRTVLVVAAALLAAPSADGQQRDAPSPPRFKSSVEVTSVDVAVVDGQGRPLQDLAATDFAVRVDGKLRKVISAEWVPLATAPTETKPIARVPEGYSSNENATGGRLIAIAVDEPHIRHGGVAAVLAAASAFIDRLAPSDRIAVVSLAPGGPVTPFVAQRERVKEAIGRMSGRRESTRTSSATVTASEAIEISEGNRLLADQVVARECATFRPGSAGASQCRQEVENRAYELAEQLKRSSSITISALREVLHALQPLDGPKTLILMSEGFSVRDSGFTNELASLAAATRTSIYALKLDDQLFEIATSRGRGGAPDLNARNDGLEALAAAARGTLFKVIGTGSQLFAQIESELSGYYLLGVESDPSDRDGKPHSIRIDVGRRGATVRTRRQLLNVPADLNRPRMGREAVAAALTAPLLMSSLPLRVATFSLRGPERAKVQLLMRVDVGTDYAASKPVVVGYLIQDKSGRIVENRTLNVTLAPLAKGVPGSLLYTGGTSLDPGDYTLKFAVAEGDRLGSVEHPVHASLFDFGDVTLSELLVGGPFETGDDLHPTVGNTVSFGALQGYLEGYGSQLDKVVVKFEVAAANGPALIQANVPTRLAGADRALFTQILPVTKLPVGDYVLRATVTSNGAPLKTLTRPFEIAPPAVLMTSAAVAGEPSAPANAELFLPVEEGLVSGPFAAGQALGPQALEPFRQRVPESTRAAFDQGVMALRAANYAAAEASFKRAIRPDAESTSALAYLAATLAAAGHDDDAASVWQTALVDGGDFPQIYEWLGDALARRHDYTGARSVLEEAVGRWPLDTRFARTLALSYATLGRGRDAIRALDRYIAGGHAEPDLFLLVVEWIFQAHNNGAVVVNGPADLAMARNYAARYATADGPKQALVQQWMDFLENEKR